MDEKAIAYLENLSSKILNQQLLNEEKLEFLKSYTGMDESELREKSIVLKRKILLEDHNLLSAYWFGFLNIGISSHPYFDKIEKLIKTINDPIKFVEIGFSYGGNLRMMHSYFDNVDIYGIEIDTKFLEWSYSLYKDKDKLPLTLFEIDITDPWFAKHIIEKYEITEKELIFHVIYCSQVFYLQNEELHIALSNIYNILDSDGYFFGYLSGYQEAKEEDNGTFIHSPDTFKRALMENGFIIDQFDVKFKGKSQFGFGEELEYQMIYLCHKDMNYT